MSSEVVGYRYSRAELSVLMRLMGIPSLPGFTPEELNEDTYNAAIASLVNAHLATRGDGKVYVDRITALILSAMHRRRGSICIETSARSAALIRSDIMFVLAEYPSRGTCVLTPLQHAEDVPEPALAAVHRCSFPALIELRSGEEVVQSSQADTEETSLPILTGLFEELCANAENPTER